MGRRERGEDAWELEVGVDRGQMMQAPVAHDTELFVFETQWETGKKYKYDISMI